MKKTLKKLYKRQIAIKGIADDIDTSQAMNRMPAKFVPEFLNYVQKHGLTITVETVLRIKMSLSGYHRCNQSLLLHQDDAPAHTSLLSRQ